MYVYNQVTYIFVDYLNRDYVGFIKYTATVILLDGRTYKSALLHKENKLLYGKPITVQNEFFSNKYNQILRGDPQHVFFMYLIKLKNFLGSII